jgi:hypothetical protein
VREPRDIWSKPRGILLQVERSLGFLWRVDFPLFADPWVLGEIVSSWWKFVASRRVVEDY